MAKPGAERLPRRDRRGLFRRCCGWGVFVGALATAGLAGAAQSLPLARSAVVAARACSACWPGSPPNDRLFDHQQARGDAHRHRAADHHQHPVQNRSPRLRQGRRRRFGDIPLSLDEGQSPISSCGRMRGRGASHKPEADAARDAAGAARRSHSRRRAGRAKPSAAVAARPIRPKVYAAPAVRRAHRPHAVAIHALREKGVMTDIRPSPFRGCRWSAAGLLVALTIAAGRAARLTGVGASTRPTRSPKIALAICVSRIRRTAHRRALTPAHNVEVTVLAPGANGFIRGVLRSFARERRANEAPSTGVREPPFRLTR